ncbi:M16 family metallopeptidase [Pectobacterium cacticida]|uniref:M16 family metallopeptidase n=1 Tax=Pectobacterium cacticida TaxID=69221 RepID=UPI003986B4F1
MTTRLNNLHTPSSWTPDNMALNIDCTTFTLDNGLTVIVHEDHQAPVVAVNVWYRVGSKDEPAGQTGFAHLFEHLMFGGSGNLPGSYLEHMLAAGALTVNGTTNRDRTNYYQTVPLEALDFALFAESDRMGHFLEGLEQDVLDRQLNVVLNEKKEREGEPYGAIFERISKTCFPAGHPYAHTVLGEEVDLKNASLEDARRWFLRWYRPSNAVLTLAGAIDVETAKEKVTRFFGHIPAGEPLQRPAVWVSAIEGQRREILEDRVPYARVNLSWNIPPYGDDETTTLLLLPAILTHGMLSVMHQKLVLDAGIATFVSAWIEPGQICSQFTIMAQAQNDTSPADLEASILDILAEFIANGVSDDTLERVRDAYLIDDIKSNATVTNIADLLSFHYGTMGDALGFRRIFSRLATITGEEIRLCAGRWLNDNRYSLHIVPFTARSLEVTPPARDVPKIQISAEITLPEQRKATLANGIAVTFAARSPQPETLISLVIPRGCAWDRFYAPGAGQLLGAILSECGTETLTANDMAEKAERLGTDISISVGQDNLTVTLRALTSRLAPALELLADRVRRSRFTEQEFEHHRSQQLSHLQSELTTPDGIAALLLSQSLFAADHPYATPMFGSGTPTSLENMAFDALSAHQSRLLVPTGAQFILAGSADFADVVNQLDTLFGDWIDNSSYDDLALPAFRANTATLYLVDKPGSMQTTIAAASLIPRLDGQEDAAFTLLHEILFNGFASRLNTSLREEHNWTYGVKGILRQHKATYIQGLSTSVQRESSGEALSEIFRQLTTIQQDRPINTSELEQFRRGELLRLRGGFEGVGQLLSYIRYAITQQRPENYWQQYAKYVAAMTPTDLQHQAQQWINPERMVWVVIGDMKHVEKEIRSALPSALLPCIVLKDNELPGL